jgi:hypothetical protein
MAAHLVSAALAASKENAPAVAAVSPLILQIRIVEGEGESYAAGSRAVKGITVEITDEAGHPVSGAAVSFRLPEDGASGVFQNGTRTEIASTGPSGRAVVWGMKWNKVVGPVVVRVTAAKGETRAGALVKQSVVEPSQAAGPVNANRKIRVRRGNKWVWISTIAAAAAGGGLAFGARGGGGGASSGSSTARAGSVTIGNPVITVGR